MFLNVKKKIKEYFNTLQFKVIFWYTIIFLLSTLFLFVLAYFYLSHSLVNADKDIIENNLQEYLTLYKTGNIQTIKKGKPTDLL
jgi:hypothetical protein